MGNDLQTIIANGTSEMKELAKRKEHMAPAEKAKAELILKTFQDIVDGRKKPFIERHRNWCLGR